MLAGMRMYLNIEDELQHRLEQRAWAERPPIPLQDLLKRLVRQQLDQDDQKEAEQVA